MKTANFNDDMNFNDSKPAISLMLETENTKEIRILMKEGQVMKEHKTSFPIVVHIVYGSINFEVEGVNHILKAGAILSLDSNVPHSLLAKEESMVRLSLAKQDTVFRVKSVVAE